MMTVSEGYGIMTRSAVIFVDAALLAFPGTSDTWRSEVAFALDRGRTLFDGALDVVLVGRTALDPHTHAALHAWDARALFSGSHHSPDLAIAAAVALDLGYARRGREPRVSIVSAALRRPWRPVVEKRLEGVRLKRRLYVPRVSDDVVLPFGAEDIDDLVFALSREGA